MGRRTSGPVYSGLVVATTALVAVMPAVVVDLLRVNGVVTGFWACLALAAGLALVASFGASALWRRHRLLPETVFSDLLVWGWLRRMYTERQIRRALASLDRLGGSGSVEERAKFLKQLAIAVDERDPYLHGHSRRVARHAVGTARRMRFHGGEEVSLIETAALLHDVGKLRTPREILMKEGPLTDSEQAVMRRHVDAGSELVQTLGDPRLAAIVLHHHERFDGCGYPRGLRGEEIPLGARVIAVADAFDAITSARPYRDGVQDKLALDVLRREAGRQLDPDVVDAFIRYYSDRDISVFAAMALSSPRTGFARTLSSAAAGALAASLTAAAAIGVSAAPHPPTPVASTLSRSPPSPPPSSAARSAPPSSSHRPRPASSSSSTSTTRAAVPATALRHTTALTVSAPATTIASRPLPCQPNCAPSTRTLPPSTRPTRTRPTRTAPTRTAPASATPTTSTTAPPTLPVTPLPCQPNCGTGVGTTTTTAPPTTTTTTTITATTTTPTTSTETSTSTTTTAPDPCKNGGWMELGYANQGECESAQHH